MGRRKGSGNKIKKRKKVTVRLIPREHAGKITEPWVLLNEIQRSNHAHLAEAQIGMAWRMGWRSDTDGHLRLGQCKKRGDLDRELDGFDFIVLLNSEAWPTLNDTQKRALIDHELCHAQIVCDADGQPKYNDRDRLVCRIRKHDVEEFRCIVDRHGVWTQDLEAIAKAAINDAARPLLAESTGTTTTGPCPRGGNHEPDGDGDCNNCGEPGVSPAPTSNAPEPWRQIKIADIKGLKPAEVDILDAEGIKTVGDWVDWPRRSGCEYTQMKNGKGRITEARYERLADAINQAVSECMEKAEKDAAFIDASCTDGDAPEPCEEEIIEDGDGDTLE